MENNYKVFEINEKRYIYLSETGKIYECDGHTLNLILMYGNNCLLDKDDKEILLNNEDAYKLIREINQAKYSTVNFDKNEYKNTISAISLLIVQNCNLRCTYCYGEDGQYQDSGIMDVETAIKAVDFLVSHSISQGVSICFFGGEPLLNFEVIRQVVLYCHENKAKFGKNIGFSMTTNGTLINEEIEKFIIDNKISVQISLDGDRDTQNKNRFDKSGHGSYDIVTMRTKNLRVKGLLGVRATVTPYNMKIKEIYRHLDSLGFRKIIISPAFNMMKGNDFLVLAEKYIEWYKDIENEMKQNNFSYVKKAKLFRQQMKKINNAVTRSSSCGVGKNLVAVDIHGNIYPCQRFVSLKDYIIGNVRDGLNKRTDFLKTVNSNNNIKCSTCWIRNLCVSGCPFCNLIDTGDMHIQSNDCCEYEKKVFYALIEIYLRLTDEEKRFILN